MAHFIPEQKVSEQTVEYLLAWIQSGIIRKLIA